MIKITKIINRIIVLSFLIFIFFANFFSNISYAIDETNEIITSQMESLNISSFIKEGQAYTKEAFPNISINDLLNSAIKGDIDNQSILERIFGIFQEELFSSISLIASILVVVLIHSILKAFSDNLDNSGVSGIAYYVEYILIVTIIMANFSKVITLINDSISNLVGFSSTLVPILLALMSASRKYCICYTYSANNSICNCFYCKFNYCIYSANYIYCSSNFNCI